MAAALHRQVARALGVDAARLPADRPLVALGLDSLAAAELGAAIEQGFGVRLDPGLLLDGLTLEELGERIRTAEPAAAPEARGSAPLPAMSGPPSHGQRALWLIDRMAPGNPAFIIAGAVRVRGTLDVPRLRRALRRLVARHAALRANLVAGGGAEAEVVTMVTRDRPDYGFRELEIGDGGDAALAAALARAAYAPFDLAAEPLLRLVVCHRGAEDHGVALALHHAVADFRSLEILVAELGRLLRGRRLAPLAGGYQDFVRAEAERLASPEGERLAAYWKEALPPGLPALALPTDRPRPAWQTFEGETRTAWLPAGVSARLRSLGRRHGATPFMALLALFLVLLERLTGQERMLVGTPTSGRSGAALAGVVGYLVNPVVVVGDLGGDPAFGELLARVRQAALAALAHQGMPFSRVAEGLAAERDPSRPPVFQAMFGLYRERRAAGGGLAGLALGLDGVRLDLGGIGGAGGLGGLDAVSFALPRWGAQVELHLAMAEIGGAFAAALEVSAALFDAATARRLLGQLAVLAEGVTGEDLGRRPVSRLPWLSAAEEQQLREWNDSAASLPRDACLHELFAAQVARTPGATAVEAPVARGAAPAGGGDGPGAAWESLTYEDLDARATALAAGLRGHGAGPESVVAIVTQRSLGLVVGLLGILKSGAAYLPLDPEYPPERLLFMLRDAGARLLLWQDGVVAAEIPGLDAAAAREMTDDGDAAAGAGTAPSMASANGLAALAAAGVTVVRLEAGLTRDTGSAGLAAPAADSADSAVSAASAAGPAPPARGAGFAQDAGAASPGNLAYVIYTSGSTGRPKGTMISHRGIVNRLLWAQERYRLAADDRVLQKTPASFDVSVWELFWPLLTGARLVLAAPGGHRDSAYLLAVLGERAVTVVHFVPAMLRAFLEHAAAVGGPRQREPLLPRLRHVMASGEALPHELQQQCAAVLGTPLHNLYGPTEAAVEVTAWDCDPASPRPLVPIGRPVANTTIRLLDRRGGPVPVGVPGELHIGGVQLARGYLGRPALTAERFAPDPRAGDGAPAGARLYRSGDLARYLADGAIDFLGRTDDQVKVRGVRVEPGEVEAVLAAHPAVAAAAVAVRTLGGGAAGQQLVGYVVPRPAVVAAPADGGAEELAASIPASARGLAAAGRPEAAALAGSSGPDVTFGSTGEEMSAAALAERIAAPSVLNCGPADAELRAWSSARLPEPMVPAHFVRLARLPLTPSGKLDRRALPLPVVSGELAGGASPAAALTPRDPVEAVVARLFAEVLGLAGGAADTAAAEAADAPDSGAPLPATANFFALGGHSLLAARLLVRLRVELGVELPLAAVFQQPTVAGVAAAATAAMAATAALRAPAPAARPPLAALPPASRPGPLVPSFAQEALWLADRLEPGSAAYNMPGSLRLRGPLRVAALAAALAALRRRHEVLRSRFAERDGALGVWIADAPSPAAGAALPLVDLTALPAAAGGACAARLEREEARRPFDLAAGGLLRTVLVRLAADDHRLLLTMHHIVSDGASLALVAREVGALYTAAVRGTPPPPEAVPALPVQYADFAAWQRGWLRGAVLAAEAGWWRERLVGDRGAPPPLELPVDGPRPADPGPRGARRTATLPAPVAAALRAVAAGRGASPFMVQAAVLGVLLRRVTGQSDVALGTVVANRGLPPLTRLVGLFVNTLVLRLDLGGDDGDPGFETLLARVRDAALAAYAHQELPFERLTAELGGRGAGAAPLFQVMLAEQPELPRLALDGLAVETLAADSGTAKFDLSLALAPAAGGALGATFTWRAGLFRPATVARLTAQWQTLAAGIAAAPTAPLSALPLLSAAERQQLLHEWSASPWESRVGAALLLHEPIARQAARIPEAVALVEPAAGWGSFGADGFGAGGSGAGSAARGAGAHEAGAGSAGAAAADRHLSYGALAALAARLANQIAARGVGPEDVVAICAEPGCELVAGLLGILTAGAAFLPLDAAQPRERLAQVLAAARPALVMGDRAAAARLPEHDTAASWLPLSPLAPAATSPGPAPGDKAGAPAPGDKPGAPTPGARAAFGASLPVAARRGLPRRPAVPESAAYVLYTSGSTGEPKGVVVPHRAIANRMRFQAGDLAPGARVLQRTRLGFDVAMVELFGPLWQGATLVLTPAARQQDAAWLAQRIGGLAVTNVNVPPALMPALLAEESFTGAAALRRVVTGGDRVPGDLPRRFFAAMRRPAPQLFARYGPTEATVSVSETRCRAGEETGSTVPLGRPIAGTRFHLLDRAGRPVPAGMPAELLLGGVQLARGYLGHPELTAAAFVPDPFPEAAVGSGDSAVGGGRLYRTGDLARFRADGTVEFLGRIDRQVKVRGFRIELGEIEAVLARHPRVSAAAVIDRDDPGGGGRRLVAYVAAPPGVEGRELRGFLAARLPAYMVPAALVRLDRLPLTANGKLDREALPEPAWGAAAARAGAAVLASGGVGGVGGKRRDGGERSNGSAGGAGGDGSEGGAGGDSGEARERRAPRTAAEEELAAIWAEVLAAAREVEDAPVGIDDDFFELGGHSLLAARVMARVRQAFGVELPLRTLFDHPTVAALAAVVEQAARAGAPAAAPPLLGLGAPGAPGAPEAPDGGGATVLSFAQERIWFLDQLAPGSAVYNVPAALRFTGDLDPALLAGCLGAIERRHDVLRSAYPAVGGVPVAVTRAAPRRVAALPVVDLTGLEVGAAAVGQALGGRLAVQPFDLASGPLLRAVLLRLARRDHLLVLVLHHIVTDGWSMAVLVRELVALYRSGGAGRAGPAGPAGHSAALPPLPVQYADFARWQRRWLRGAVLEAQLAWWRGALAGAPDQLALPTDRPRPPAETHRGGGVTALLPAALAAAFRRHVRARGATLFMGLLAAFDVLLHRWSGAADLVVGSPVANRGRVETEGLIGCFINTLALRTDLSGRPGFDELLARVRQMSLAAFAHQDLPFEKLVEALHPRRELGSAPLVQVLLALHNQAEAGALRYVLVAADGGAGGGLTLELAGFPPTTAKLDLTLAARDVPEGLALAIEYRRDLFDPATMLRLAEHLRALLAGIVAGEGAGRAPGVAGDAGRVGDAGEGMPGRDGQDKVAAPAIEDLPWFSAAERQQLLEWNDTAVLPGGTLRLHEGAPRGERLPLPGDGLPADEGLCLHELFAAQARRTPAAPAVLCDATDESVSYGALAARAEALARSLRRLGVGPETVVALAAERSVGMMVGLLAILEAGGAFLPLDPEHPPERWCAMLDDSGAPVLVGQRHLLARLGGVAAATVCLDDAAAPWNLQEEPDEGRDAPARAAARARAQDPGGAAAWAAPENLAYVIYTSGSTGRPKGTMNTHRGIVNRLLWMQRRLGLGAGDRLLQKTPASFDVSVGEMFAPLVAGACLVMARPGGHRDSGYLLQAIAARAITTVHFVPSMLRAFLDAVEAAEQAATAGRPHALAGLRHILASGEALPHDLQERCAALAAAPLHNLYGPTEAAVEVTGWTTEPGSARRLVPIGRPAANTRIWLLDRHGQAVPSGVPAELHIGGVQLARGYLGQPALTAERFVPDGLARAGGEPGGRLYHTGDLARHLADGAIDYLGRTDLQVKIRGVRVELGEIEAALLALPGVRAAAAAAVAGRGAAADDRRLVAYVVAQEGAAPAAAALRQALAARLPEQMVPAEVVFLERLPLTGSGKLDRRALPAPGPRPDGAGAAWVAPRTAAELRVAGLFAEVLGIETVGAEDEFFALGGHSLLATRLVSRLRQAFGVEVPLRAVFQHPTVAALARWAAAEAANQGGEGAAAAPPLTRRTARGPAPLSFAQQRIWFLDRLAGGTGHAYNIPAGLRLLGRLDAAALARALGAVAGRHEALRTVFAETAAGPVQVVRDPAPAALPLIDLGALAGTGRAAARDDEAGRLRAAFARRPFDLAVGPLLRAALLRLGPEEHHLLATQHHAVSDAWSMGILLGELGAFYTAFAAEGGAGALPPLPVQYADFAVWQREWLSGGVLERELAWWRGRLAGATARLELPTDRPRPAVRSGHGAGCRVELAPDLGAALAGAARRQSATLAAALLAGFAALLGRHGNQRDLSLGMPVAGRNRLETEGLIGCFVNTLVLRADLGAAAGFGGLVSQMRDTLLDAQLHQDLPFEKLVEELEPDRNLQLTPLFQALLTLQNTPLPPPALAGLAAEPLAAPPVTAAKLDLGLNLAATAAGGLSGTLAYSTDLFDGATAARLAAHLATLLAAGAAAPAAPLAELPLLAAAERHQLLIEWNDTAAGPAAAEDAPGAPIAAIAPTAPIAEVPHGLCLHELAALWAAAEPEAVVVACEDAALSRGELDRRAARLARRLRAAGAGPEAVVGLRLEMGLDLIVAVLATLKAGGAYLALDPELPAQRLAAVCADARPCVLVSRTAPPEGIGVPVIDPAAGGAEAEGGSAPEGDAVSRAGAAAASDGRAAASDGRAAASDGRAAAMADDTAPAGPPAVDPANLAYVIYTSGSTGTPKRVGIEHRQVTAYLPAVLARLGLPRRALLSLHQTLAVDAPVTQLFAALSYGAALQLMVRERALDAERAADYLGARPVDFLKIAPSHLGALLAGTRPRDILPRRLAMLGGEALPWPLAEQIAALGGPGRLINHYGPTETSVGVLTWFVPPHAPHPSQAGARPDSGSVPIGRPLGNVRAYVLDAHLEPVAAGLAGELHIGGPQVTRGYLGRGDLTAERFRPDPWAAAPGARMYATGDLVRAGRGGVVEFLGRNDFQVKIRGFRIELGEIEAALQALPGVAAAAVVAVAGAVRGAAGAEPLLAAYVVPREGAAPTAAGLRRALAERLPEAMVPRSVTLLAALPRTPHGKLDRKALPAPREDAAEASSGASPGTLGEPRDAVEQALADAWSHLLGRPPAGREQGFFDAGGHSLLATQLASHLRRSLGVDLPLRDLFASPAFGALAERLRGLVSAGAGGGLPPLLRVAGRGDELPLSFAQQRLWFIDQLEPGSVLYNMSYALELTGELRPALLARCLAEVRRRHETLRTVFHAGPGGPRQVVLPMPPTVPSAPAVPSPAAGRDGTLPLVDLTALPAGRLPAVTAELIAVDGGRPFDLGRGPLLRVVLLRRGARDHVALVSLHHIVSDGWSRGVLVREIGALYRAFAVGEASPLPELPVQYGDYTLWQRVWLSGATVERDVAWWREQLRGVPPLVNLPLDRARAAVVSPRGRGRRLALPAGWGPLVRGLARRHGATPFMALYAGVAGLLSRYGAGDRFAVGSPIAGRRHVELEPLIGFFSNIVVLAADLGGRPGFGALLGRARETCIEAYAHQDLPFEKLVEELAPERSRAHAPLFQVLMVLQNTPKEEIELPGLSLRPLPPRTTVSKFDLIFAFEEAGEELTAAAQWNAELFDTATVTRLGSHLVALLAAAEADPERWFAELPLLTPAERHQVAEWNATRRAAPAGAAATLAGLVAAQAACTPDAVAAVLGDEALTYGELGRRAAALAGALAARGVGPDVAVALCISPSLDMAVAVVAVLAAGGAYLPLDPGYPRERLAAMIEDGRPPVLLATAEAAGRLPEPLPPALPWQEVVRRAPPGSTLQEAPGVSGAVGAGVGAAVGAVAAASLGYLIFTSGSTGRPKGIGMPQGALVNLIRWCLASARCDVRTLQFASLSFDVSFYEMFACWAAGGTLVLIPESLRRDARGLAAHLTAAQVERAVLPVLLLLELAEIYAEPGAAPPPWREIISAGEQMQVTPAVAGLFARLPGCRLHNHYGPSETHAATALTLGGEPRTWEPHPPIGRPLPNARIELLGAGLERVPPGAPGELYIGGAGLARGYAGRPEMTAERFVPDPWSRRRGERLYRSGDLARQRPGGTIEYLGRADHQVKIRGFRVEPAEVEVALARHPALAEAVVVAMDAAAGGKRLVAYVVGLPGVRRPGGGELRVWLGERLPHFMVPAAFVWLDRMPLSPNGKVERRALPPPEAVTGWQEGTAGGPPRDLVELRLAAVWEELLGGGPVGPADSFFALGGHSLLAVRLMNRIEAAFGQRLPVAALFDSPTLEGLAARLRQGEPPGRREPLVHLRGGGPGMPLFLVHPVGGNVLCYWELARAIGDGTPVYGLQLPDAPEPGIEGLASRYAAAVREVQPEGPYHLAGWSLGGVIAHEMARQLDREGHEVGLLALVDSHAPVGPGLPQAGAGLVRLFGADLAGLLGQARPQQAPLALPEDEAEALAALDTYGRAQGLLPPDLGRESVAHLFTLFRTSAAALAAHRPEPYRGEALLFAATESPTAAAPDRGWEPLVGRLDVLSVAGDHYAMMRQPAAGLIAAALRERLAGRRLLRAAG